MLYSWCQSKNIIYCYMNSIHRPAWHWVIILGLDQREYDLKVALIVSPSDGSHPKAWANNIDTMIRIEKSDYTFLGDSGDSSYISGIQLHTKRLTEAQKEFAEHDKAKPYGKVKDHHYIRLMDILANRISTTERLIINTRIRLPESLKT